MLFIIFSIPTYTDLNFFYTLYLLLSESSRVSRRCTPALMCLYTFQNDYCHTRTLWIYGKFCLIWKSNWCLVTYVGLLSYRFLVYIHIYRSYIYVYISVLWGYHWDSCVTTSRSLFYDLCLNLESTCQPTCSVLVDFKH